jgi:YjbE family integral membrane protein
VPHFTLDAEFVTRLLGILLIDIMLAGDNALVIALAARTLPRHQQLWARIWGTMGAVVLRIAFIAVATTLLKIPWLQLAGGLLLIWIGVKLVREDGDTELAVRPARSIWSAVWIIVMADAVMSFDNVVAVAGAAGGDLVLVAVGIAISVPLVVWGSGVLARLMRFPWVVWLGGGVLGFVAGHMICADKSVLAWVPGLAAWPGIALALALAAAIFAFGAWGHRHLVH